jgi:hypothetical protein
LGYLPKQKVIQHFKRQKELAVFEEEEGKKKE